MRLRYGIAIVAVAAMPWMASNAQTARADSLLNAGALQRAESLYYSAVQMRPRDPMARWALGKYLVARGAPRVGMTLFEEALQFGGDPAIVNAELAPTYLVLGEYHKLSALKASPLSAPERERARWLVARSTQAPRPRLRRDLTLKKSSDVAPLGRVAIRVNGRTVDATITAREHGIIIADTSAVGEATPCIQATRRSRGVGRRNSRRRRLDRSRTDQSRRLSGYSATSREQSTSVDRSRCHGC